MSSRTSSADPIDEALVNRILAGDESAEFELNRRWWRRLTALARSILRDDELAEDTAQLALWRAITHLKRYDSSRPFESWILAIARNCARDLLRSRKARPTVSGEGLLDRVAGGHEEGPNRIARKEETEALRACLEGLSERIRTVVVLHALGFSLEKTGQALQAPKTTVQSWLEKALEQLRRCMTGKGFGEYS